MKVIFAVLSLALLAGVVVGREKPVETLLKPDAPVANAAIDVSRLERAQDEVAPAADPFARRSFGAAERRVKTAAPKAEAPLLPFRYMGKVIDNGKEEILLLNGTEQYAVAPGDKLGADYRLDKVTGTALVFTYLPLKTKQTLDIPK
jgi:hypothetical protein